MLIGIGHNKPSSPLVLLLQSNPMELEKDHRELQLLPTHTLSSSSSSSASRLFSSWKSSSSIDLQLSISLDPVLPQPPPSEHVVVGRICPRSGTKSSTSIDALRWQAAEQIRLATLEKAYAEKVRELSRREMEMAQAEFARARHIWERAREDVEKAERLKQIATRRIDSTCMEITCQSCRKKFLRSKDK